MAAVPAVNIGPVGVWTRALDTLTWSQAAELAAEIEEQGWPTLWLPEALARDPLIGATLVLDATQQLRVATGIVNIHMRHPLATAIAQRSILDAHPERFLLGLGVSHAPMVEHMLGGDYRQPVATMRSYLDAMDATAPGQPRVLAALGPRMLGLAAERSQGAHPYLVPVSHTAAARQALGVEAVLAPDLRVVLETDAGKARELARTALAGPLAAANYQRNLLRCGFEEADLADGGSDRLVDAVVAWGDADTVAARVREHHDAGASHVGVNVVTEGDEPPLRQWQELADVLLA